MFEEQGAAPESPTGTESYAPATDPTSAGTQNTDQQGQVVTDNRGNVIPPWRINEMVQRASESAALRTRQEMAQEMAAERERMQSFFAQQSQQSQQALLQGLQQRVQQPSRSPEEEAQRQQALGALNGLLRDNPEWANMQRYAQAGPALAQGMLQAQKQIAAMEQRQLAIHTSSEEGRLRDMAREAGLPADHLNQLYQDVTRIVGSDQRLLQAWANGDARVLPYAFDLARKQYAQYEQSARASLNAAKTATSRLPPPIRGGTPGTQPPIPKFDPKDPRGSMAKIHASAAAAYQDLASG